MFSLCFIELQQMSNELEKLLLFKLPSVLFVQWTPVGSRGWGVGEGTRTANRIHVVTFI